LTGNFINNYKFNQLTSSLSTISYKLTYQLSTIFSKQRKKLIGQIPLLMSEKINGTDFGQRT